MKNENFIFGGEPFDHWLAEHPDVERLTIKGHIYTDKLEDIDEQIFKSSIKTLEIGDIILKDKDFKSVSFDDYAFTFLDEGNLLPRLFKMLANTKHSSIYSISDDLILSEDGEVLVHIEETETYTLQIPENVRIIGDYAFAYHHDLEGVNFPDGLREIGAHAFEGCYNLECIDLPDTVLTLGDNAFCECCISSIRLSANITEIPAHCFENNDLTTFELPLSVKIIRQEAFSVNPIKKITFNQGLESVEANAFPALCYAKFPASMKEIAVDFYRQPKDERNSERNVPYIEVDDDNPYLWAKNGTLYKKGNNALCLEAPFHCKTEHYKIMPELVIPANLQPKSVILKWNPSFSSFQMSGYIGLIQDFTLMKGHQRFDSMNWSVWDYDKINVGDRVYWVKVGYGQIGIVGSGTVTSEPYRSEDWSGKGRIIYYVDFVPDVLLNPDTVPILTCQELQRTIPDFDWYKGHSGLVLNNEQAHNLDTLWKDFLQKNDELFKEKMQKKRNEQVYIE